MDVMPDTKIAESSELFNNESSLTSLTNGLYQNIDYSAILNDNTSDNMAYINTPPAIRWGQYTQPTALGSGGWSWSELRQINYIIYNINRYTKSDDLKHEHLGIAKFFRAWFYFKKVKAFGDVPWYSKPLSTTDDSLLYKKRDSRILIVNNILSDLDYSIRYLSSDKSLNKITRWTALALKSRVSLYEGTWRIYHTYADLPGGKDLLDTCIEASKELMQSGEYKIYSTGDPEDDYKNMFLATTANSDETILAKSFSEASLFSYTPQFISTSNGNYGATNSLVSDYPMLDGQSYYSQESGQLSEVKYYDEFQNRDYRLSASIKGPGYIRPGTTTTSINDFSENATGYQVVKRVGPPSEDQGGDRRDVILFRYAEVLLNYAEARAILGELNQNDLDLTINVLRKRAGVPLLTYPLHTDLLQLQRYTRTKSADILEVCRARRIELAFEGFRTDDLIRWNEGQLFRSKDYGIFIPNENEYIDLDNDGKYDLYVVPFGGSVPSPKISGVQYFKLSAVNALSEGTRGRLIPYRWDVPAFQNYEYLKPIPIEELTLNPNLIQNPDWSSK
jgi:hypothetical protein